MAAPVNRWARRRVGSGTGHVLRQRRLGSAAKRAADRLVACLRWARAAARSRAVDAQRAFVTRPPSMVKRRPPRRQSCELISRDDRFECFDGAAHRSRTGFICDVFSELVAKLVVTNICESATLRGRTTHVSGDSRFVRREVSVARPPASLVGPSRSAHRGSTP